MDTNRFPVEPPDPDWVAANPGWEQVPPDDPRWRPADKEGNLGKAAQETADEIPHINVQPGFRHLAADAGIDALKKANAQIWQRGTDMVRVVVITAKASDEAETSFPGIEPVTLPYLMRKLNESATWTKPGKGKNNSLPQTDCPKAVAEEIASMAGEWNLPPLRGVIATPTLRHDGSILSKPGYDRATGLYLHGGMTMEPIPDNPTKEDAAAALSLLDGLLEEFSFVSKVDKAVALSMLITPVLRPTLGDAVPMHVVTAPAPGSGKSYLADLASVIAIGQKAAVLNLKDAIEADKRLVGAALQGRQIICIDNFNGDLEGDFLAQVTERPILELRVLGIGPTRLVANTFTVFSNGNNIRIIKDLTRRVVRCCLDTRMEDPSIRIFSGDPAQTVLNNRGKFVRAILIMVRAYITAGYPNRPSQIPSYGRWTELVCGTLVWLGCEHPINSRAAVQDEDPSVNELSQILTSWPVVGQRLDTTTPLSTAKLVELAVNERTDIDSDMSWRDAVIAVASGRAGIDKAKFGMWLRRYRDRMIGTKMLRQSKAGNHKKVPHWYVEEAGRG